MRPSGHPDRPQIKEVCAKPGPSPYLPGTVKSVPRQGHSPGQGPFGSGYWAALARSTLKNLPGPLTMKVWANLGPWGMLDRGQRPRGLGI